MRSTSTRLLLLAALGLGCANEKERPPPPTCVGDCGLSPGLGAGQQPPAGGAGADGEGGSDGGTSRGIELTGNVLVLNDDVNFATGDLFTDTANIQTEGADGKVVKGSWDGINPFALEKVKQARPVWVLITPPSGVADDALPALEPVRTDKPDADDRVETNLALVHASTLEHIFGVAALAPPTDTTKGQVILLLQTRVSGATTPSPLSGLSVQASSAENVIYAASGSFSTSSIATDDTGVVVLANVAAASWPGAIVDVVYGGAKTGGSQIRAVSGAVTLVTLVL